MPQRILDQLELKGTPLQQISQVQTWFAKTFEFENLDVFLNNEEPITEQYLLKKMVEDGRGGVCYELNGLLHLVLRELGFDVSLAGGTVAAGDEWKLDGTHTINLLKYEDTLYVIDSGLGNNLALAPIPLDGEPVVSPSGSYRLRSKQTEKGSIVLEQWAEDNWKVFYAFSPDRVDWDDLSRVKELIHHDPNSPFNESILVAKVVGDGTFSINEERFNRKWTDGRTETVRFEKRADMLEQLKFHAAPAVYEAAVKLSR